MRAISRFDFEAGRTTSVWRARLALRRRVSMSAIGSVTFIASPARLRHARDLAKERPLAEADAAQPKATDEGARAAAHEAAVVCADGEAGCPLRLGDERLLGHSFLAPFSR